jgi:hypothetical protein
MHNEPKPKKKLPALVLAIGFLPSLLGLISLFLALLLTEQSQSEYLPHFCEAACVLSAICGISCPMMLFRKKNGLAIAGGIGFLVLNGLISYAFFVYGLMLVLSRGGHF